MSVSQRMFKDPEIQRYMSLKEMVTVPRGMGPIALRRHLEPHRDRNQCPGANLRTTDKAVKWTQKIKENDSRKMVAPRAGYGWGFS